MAGWRRDGAAAARMREPRRWNSLEHGPSLCRLIRLRIKACPPLRAFSSQPASFSFGRRELCIELWLGVSSATTADSDGGECSRSVAWFVCVVSRGTDG